MCCNILHLMVEPVVGPLTRSEGGGGCGDHARSTCGDHARSTVRWPMPKKTKEETAVLTSPSLRAVGKNQHAQAKMHFRGPPNPLSPLCHCS